jgi:multidrug efflux pump subunit AcrB
MRIWFDAQRLDNLQLTPADVITAIQAQNVQAPIGRIGARPIGNDQQFQVNVQTQGRLTTPEQFGNIVLRANPDGLLPGRRKPPQRPACGRDRARTR